MLPAAQWTEWQASVVGAGVLVALVILACAIRCLQRKCENAIHAALLSGYQRYLRTLAETPETGASHGVTLQITEACRTRAMATLLLVLFEEAYISMHRQPWPMMRNRHWSYWDRRLLGWCAIAEIRELLPQLLIGKDPEFVRYCRSLLDRQPQLHDSANAAVDKELAFTSPKSNPWIHALNSRLPPGHA
jgi:hypothetical protein